MSLESPIGEKHKHLHHLVRGLEAKALKKRPWSLRFADEMTGFFGSIYFLLANAIVFIIWIIINSYTNPVIYPFDPFPFPMLTTVVSLEAIILTTIVLMSQNRQSLISSLREEVDIQVNLTSEREITKILKLLSLLLAKQGVKIDDEELKDMLKEIDESYIERKLEHELTDKHS